jgi:hypothetical protein
MIWSSLFGVLSVVHDGKFVPSCLSIWRATPLRAAQWPASAPDDAEGALRTAAQLAFARQSRERDLPRRHQGLGDVAGESPSRELWAKPVTPAHGRPRSTSRAVTRARPLDALCPLDAFRSPDRSPARVSSERTALAWGEIDKRRAPRGDVKASTAWRASRGAVAATAIAASLLQRLAELSRLPPAERVTLVPSARSACRPERPANG